MLGMGSGLRPHQLMSHDGLGVQNQVGGGMRASLTKTAYRDVM